jgi:hypothetical protein
MVTDPKSSLGGEHGPTSHSIRTCLPAGLNGSKVLRGQDVPANSRAKNAVDTVFLLRCRLRLTNGHERAPASRRSSPSLDPIPEGAGAVDGRRQRAGHDPFRHPWVPKVP